MWCEYNNQKKKKNFMEVSAIFPFKKLKSLMVRLDWEGRKESRVE